MGSEKDWTARRRPSGLAQKSKPCEQRGRWNSSPLSKLRDSLIEVGRLPAVGSNPAAGFLRVE